MSESNNSGGPWVVVCFILFFAVFAGLLACSIVSSLNRSLTDEEARNKEMQKAIYRLMIKYEDWEWIGEGQHYAGPRTLKPEADK